MISDEVLHDKICKRHSDVKAWFQSHRAGLPVPIYSSFDIRDSGHKVVPVDANIFPAGFNNICATDRDEAVQTMDSYLRDHYDKSEKIVLITEEHTGNPYYWSNVLALRNVLEKTKRQIVIAIPGERPEPLRTKSVDGEDFVVQGAKRVGNQVEVEGFKPDLIVSNNDFSNAYAEWADGLATPMNPPHQFGWFRRRKNEFFDQYNRLAGEFCDILDIDPWHFQLHTKLFENFDANDSERRTQLANVTSELLTEMQQNFAKRQIQSHPFAVIKNNAGTYGLGVTMVESGQQVLDWNYKSRKTMKAAKGGRDIEEVIVQEGVATRFVDKGETAEPVIYMIGCQLAGGFLRTHPDKGPAQNLNSPGAVYKRLCVTDLKVSLAGSPMENVYGWVAKLSLLAISFEARENSVKFLGYHPTEAC